MHRNKENDVSPQDSPDIGLQKFKSMVREIVNRGTAWGLKKVFLDFLFTLILPF